MSEKIEWRKSEPRYKTKKPELLLLPQQSYFMIDGLGDPNKEDFQRRVAALYPAAYAIRMSQKNDWEIPDFQLYTVYPLEGYWTVQKQYYGQELKKDHFAYTLMIKQPDFVTPAVAAEALERAKSKIPEDLFSEIRFETVPEKEVAQVLHIGSFDDEPATFERLHQFIEESGYQRISKDHKEVYLSDPRKVAPEKLKTILQVEVAKI